MPMSLENRNLILKDLRDLCSAVEDGSTILDEIRVDYEISPILPTACWGPLEQGFTGRQTITLNYTIPRTRDPRLP